MDKNRMYDVMINFIEIERKMDVLLVILYALEEYYDMDGQKDVYAVVSLAIWQIEMLRQQMDETITVADEFLLENERI